MAKKGICGICGKGGKLTDEHIPPICAGNVKGAALNTMADWLEAKGDPTAMKKGQPRPNGTFWATICERCNNHVLGSWYVPDLCQFVGGVTYALIKSGFAARRAELKKGSSPWTRIVTPALRPLCLVKSIAGMVLALNADVDEGFRERHKPLADCLLDRNAPLPEPYRAYLAIHDGNYATFAPTMYLGDPAGPDAIAFSAIEQPPFAYILTFDERDPDTIPFLPCGGLRDFGRASYDAVGELSLDLLVGFRDTPVPGFYGQRMDAADSADTPREA